MKYLNYRVLLCAALAWCGAAAARPIAMDGNTVIVRAVEEGKFGEFAAGELASILGKTLNAKLRIVGSDTPEATAGTSPKIHVGRSKFVTAKLGDAFVKSLKNEESAVAGRGNDLILVGGGDLGTLYAVYDFVEDAAGYRMFGPCPGMEKIVPAKRVLWNGPDSRRKPAFPGYRISHSMEISQPLLAKFMLRNRNNGTFNFHNGKPWFFDSGYRSEFFRVMGSQHGLFLFVPPFDRDMSKWLKVKWPGSFQEHPEYFSLGPDGKRTPTAQLCFSNPELRKLFTRRFREVVAKNGPGVYMVGSEDSHNRRYCDCAGCKALMDQYRTNGGPLWDYILELCRETADLPHVYITSLAYKGPEQTEKAPAGVTFPANFICDTAFLNSDRSLREIAVGPDGFNRMENLKTWCRNTGHVSYWYYGGANPLTWFGRMPKELRELREAGVKSVGSCGVGGGVEFSDIAMYLYYRLLQNPDADARAIVREAVDFKYGKAAPLMMEYFDDLEALRVQSLRGPGALGADDTYEKVAFLTGKDIVRFQRRFEKMLEAVQDAPAALRQVKIARLGADIWTILFAPRIRSEVPDYALDVEAAVKRGLESCAEIEKNGFSTPARNPARRVLETMGLYAKLKTEALPPELAQYSKETVSRHLPTPPPHFFAKRAPLIADPGAAAEFAMYATAKDGFPQGVVYQFYDAVNKSWRMTGYIPTDKLRSDRYTPVRLGEAELPRSSCLVFGNFWGSSLDIRNLDRYYDPSYQARRFEFWASLKLDGNKLYCDQVFLVNRGLPKQ